MLSSFYVALFWLVFFFCYWYLKNYMLYRNLAKKVACPSFHPILGNASLFLGNLSEITKKVMDVMSRYTHRVGIWRGPILQLFVMNPHDTELIIKCPEFQKSKDYEVFMPFIGESTFSIAPAGLKLKQHKKAMMPWFKIGNIKDLAENFNITADELVGKFKNKCGEEFNVKPYISYSIMSSLSEAVFGLKKASQNILIPKLVDINERVLENITERVHKLWLRNSFIYYITGTKAKTEKIQKEVNDLIEIAVEERRTNPELKPKFKILLDVLTEATLDNGSGFSEEDLRSEIKTIFFAGYATTMNTLGFVLSLIGLYKDVQDNLFEEVTSILGNNKKGFISYEDAIKFEYMDRVLQETWRLYPPAALFTRISQNDVQLGDMLIPKNTNISVLIMNLHRNPESFPNPLKFNPDNFLPGLVKQRHPYSFIPFSMGSRGCLGQKFAYLDLKIYLAKLIRNFKFHSNIPEKDFKIFFQISLTREDGYPLVLEPRAA